MNLILAGIGGQGILTASNIILETALHCGYNVRSAETIGMTQKGGSVCSHIRIGETIIYSPLISYNQADEIIMLDEGEAARYVPYLKQDGLMKIITYRTREGNELEKKLKKISASYLDFQEIILKLGSKKFENVAMLGAAFSNCKQPFSVADLEFTIRKKYKDSSLRKNLEALYLGFEMGRSMYYEKSDKNANC